MPTEIWKKYAPQEPGAVTLQDPNEDDKDCAKCDKHRDKIKQLATLVEDLLRNQSRLEIDRRAIEQREERLREKHEEMKNELNGAKAEVARLRASTIDVTKYEEWTPDEFVDYICIVENGRFLKYESILREKFKNDEVSGEAIPHIEKNEWRDFGIKNYMDRTQIHKCIKDLVNGKTPY